MGADPTSVPHPQVPTPGLCFRSAEKAFGWCRPHHQGTNSAPSHGGLHLSVINSWPTDLWSPTGQCLSCSVLLQSHPATSRGCSRWLREAEGPSVSPSPGQVGKLSLRGGAGSPHLLHPVFLMPGKVQNRQLLPDPKRQAWLLPGKSCVLLSGPFPLPPDWQGQEGWGCSASQTRQSPKWKPWAQREETALVFATTSAKPSVLPGSTAGVELPSACQGCLRSAGPGVGT